MKQLRNHLFSVGGVGVFLFLALATMPSNRNDNGNGNAGPSSNTTRYTNSRSAFSGQLADKYVDFSFEYPKSWTRDPEAGKGDSSNFVKVTNDTSDKFTIENFAVGTFWGGRALMPQLVSQLSDQFSNSFSNYEKVSEGETRIGSIDGYEFRFKSRIENTSRGPVDFWGRVVLLPSSGSRGVALVMLASSVGNEVRGPQDVGEKGDLPIILKSFRFGN